MKAVRSWLALIAFSTAIVTTSCDRKKEAPPAPPKAEVPTGEAASPEAKTPAETGVEAGSDAPAAGATPTRPVVAAARLQLGLANRVPATAEGYLGLYNLKGIREQISASAFWGAAVELFEQIDTEETDQADTEEAKRFFDALFSQEMGLVLGEGSGEFLRRLVQIGNINDKATMKSLGSAGGFGLGGTDPADSFSGLFDEMDEVLPHLKDLKIPAVTILFRVEDAPAFLEGFPEKEAEDGEEARPPVDYRLGEGFSGEAGKASTIDGPGGHPLKIFTLRGSELLTDEGRENVAGLIEDADEAAEFIAFLEGLEISFARGALDDQTVLLSIGPDTAALGQFVESATQTVGSAPEIAFIDPHLDDNITTLTWFRKEFLEGLQGPHPMSSVLEAIGESLEETEGMEELAAEMQPRFEGLIEQGDKRSQFEVTPHVGIGWLDDESTFRMEAKGGVQPAGIVLDKAVPFELPTGEDVLFSMSSVADPEYSAAGWQYFEDFVSTLVGGVKSFAASKQKQDADGSQQAGTIAMALGMESMISPSILKIYGGIKSVYREGFGDEFLLAVDLGGSLPKIPGLSDRVISQGRVPRLALAHTVRDRASVASAWEQIVPAMNGLLGFVPSPSGQIKIPEFESREDGELTTYFHPIPGTSDDLLPSVSLNDEVFLMGTSKNLSEAVAAGLGAEPEPGIHIHFNFAPLASVASTWMELALDGELPDTRESANPDKEIADMEFAKTLFELMAAFGKVEERFFEEEGDIRFHMNWAFQDIIFTN